MSSPNVANFDRLARIYRWMEWLSFGPWLSLTRRTFLRACSRVQHALIFGDGDGRFTASLLRTNLTVRVDAVDASPAMLAELSRRSASHADRLTTFFADARNWQPPISAQPYDLVVTHFFLDCLSQAEVDALAVKVSAICTPSAIWIVSEFAIPYHGPFASMVARPLVSFLYLCFRHLTGLEVRQLPNHTQSLQNAGFTRHEVRTHLFGLLISELWSREAKWIRTA